MSHKVPLTKMSPGQEGIVVEILGGHNATRRLEALGLRIGVKVTKVSSMLLRGPVTVQIGESQIAIGYGLASKVMVETK